MKGRPKIPPAPPPTARFQRAKVDTQADIWRAVAPELDNAPKQVRDMFVALIEYAPTQATLAALQLDTAAHRNTVISRFDRAGLPTMKQYHDRLRILYALRFLDLDDRRRAVRIWHVAEALGFSSSQAMCRSMRRVLGITPQELASRSTFDGALADFVRSMFREQRPRFSRFYPLAGV